MLKRDFHVAVNGCDDKEGTKDNPFKTIGRAAKVAKPGDTVIVHEGEYREWVKPENGGRCEIERITYKVASGEKVTIKGSEIIDDWENVGGTLWKSVVDNTIFGSYNPFATEIKGDWLIHPEDWFLHAGDVYLNGKSLYEARTLADAKKAVKRYEGFNPKWTKKTEQILHPEDTIYQWFAEVEPEHTTIYANFQDKNPNQELVEISVRRSCFYPEKTGVNYITVTGFEMCQAATLWAPPTADQPGLIGPNWSKGWIIENNTIHDAKCSAISIGKEASTGHNESTITRRKPGYQYQMEAVFRALEIGWSKEKIGSHIIRNNVIYDCGQNAIVGHMGCAFCEIYGNHIYNIAVKHEFYGYEIAGIKLHAAIDTQIYHNNLHNCTLGIWLDWQAQGTRVSKNLFYDNDRDLFIEVTHGPHIVDNNIFASYYNFDNIAHGGAFLHNLCCGTMRRETVLDRATPYHYPHSTKPLSTTFVYNGDDRWYQNIFVGGAPTYTEQSTSGTADYNGNPTSLEEYVERICELGNGDHEIFHTMPEPVYINRNAYFKGSLSFEKEEEKLVSKENPEICIITEDGKTYLEINVCEDLLKLNTKILETQDLGTIRIVAAPFDDPSGDAIVFDSDFQDVKREKGSIAGPFAKLQLGRNRILVWE